MTTLALERRVDLAGIDLDELLLALQTNIASAAIKQVNKSSATKKPRYLTLSTVRNQMEHKIEDFIKGNSNGKVLNLRVPAGAGKSHIATKVINRSMPKGTEVVWFASMHDQFKDLGSLRKRKWFHIRGRTEGSGYVPENCRYAREARYLGRKNYPISETLCKKRCHDMGKCKYWAQLRKKGHKFLPHQLLFFFDGKDASLVVFDELNLNIFTETHELDSNALTQQAQKDNRGFWKALNDILMEGIELSGQAFYDKLDSILPGNGSLADKLNAIEFEDSKDSNVGEGEEIPIHNIGQKLKDVMLSEIGLLKKQGTINPRIVANPKYHQSTKAVLQIRIRIEPPPWLKDKPIILLGAKGAPELFQKVLTKRKRDFINYSPKMKIPVEVEIAKEQDALLPEATLKSKITRLNVCDEIKAHLDCTLNRTCVICHKDFEEHFASLFGLKRTQYRDGKVCKYQDTGHYWGIRGLNVWKDYDQIILIGTPTPNIDDMVRQVQAIYWDDSALDKTVTKVNNVQDYKDKRVSWYLHSLREDELYQAIFRIRPLELNGRKKIKIIVATALPLEDIDPLVSTHFKIETMAAKNQQGKYNTLKTAAAALLKRQSSFTRQDLLGEVCLTDKSIHPKFIVRNIQQLIKELKLIENRTCPRKYHH